MTTENNGALDANLTILLQEYQSKEEQIENCYRLILEVTSIAFVLFGALLAYVFPSNTKFPIEIYWFLPLTFAVPFSLVIQLLFKSIFLSYYLRDLENAIAPYAKFEYFHFEFASTRALWSSKRGSFLGFRVTYGIITLVAVGLYAILTWLGFDKISNITKVGFCYLELKWWFLIVSIIVIFIMLCILVASQASIKKAYLRWREGPFKAGNIESHYKISTLLRLIFIPRPHELLFKSTIYWGVVAFSTWVLQLKFSWTIAWTVIAVFFCIDYLAKQTTYLWNDIKDFTKDSKDRTKDYLPLQTLHSAIPGKIVFIPRLVVTIGISFWVAKITGLWWLPLLSIVILCWQFIYDNWGRKYPLRKLITCSLGYMERAIPGLLVISYFKSSYDIGFIFMTILWVLAFAFVFSSASWLAASRRTDKNEAMKEEEKVWWGKIGKNFTLPAILVLLSIGLSLNVMFGSVNTQEFILLFIGCISVAAILFIARDKFSLKNRWYLLITTIVISGLMWLRYEKTHWIILVFGAPLLIGIGYLNLTWGEIYFTYLKDLLGSLVARVDHLLFSN